MQNRFVKIFLVFSFFIVGALLYWLIVKENQIGQEEKNFFQEEKGEEIIFQPEINSKKDLVKDQEKKEESLPDKIISSVPFTSQAPFEKWDEYHEEACEEASLLMVKYFAEKKALTPELAEKEIQALIKFQLKRYGDYKDSDVSQIVKLGKDFYQLENLEAIYDFKKEEIKKWLARDKPIIVPAAGRLLGNPNFTPPGPLYHNLVLVGYDGDWIITNDPGTKKGKGYRYHLDILYRAIHDFPGKKEQIETGRKAMVVIN